MALMNQAMFLKFMLFNQTRHVSDEPSSIVSCTNFFVQLTMDDGSSETCVV